MFLRYIACVGLLNLFWEILQLPLYTLWYESSPATIAFAVVHCTLGDLLIATISFFAALVLSSANNWPQQHYGRVALMAGIQHVQIDGGGVVHDIGVVYAYEYKACTTHVSRKLVDLVEFLVNRTPADVWVAQVKYKSSDK